jgi:signal transduction histidine kinase
VTGAVTNSGDQRLEQLLAISKLFASFENVAQTFDPALEIVAQTLPLRSAILIETYDGHLKMFISPSSGQSPAHIQAVKQHAVTAYKYLSGIAPDTSLDLTEQAGMPAQSPQPETEEGTEENLATRLIVIPLVVAHRPPFGVLQLEGARSLDKGDLMFVNAIANQLAIALDRDHAWRLDISLRRDAEAMAAENARLYQEAQRAIGVREQILAVVSHDLRNPLGAILLTMEGLRGNPLDERRDEVPQAITRIRRASERMLRLIDDLLDVTSIDAGRLSIERGPHDAGPILEETLASFEDVAQEKRLRMTAEVQPNLPKAFCDRDRILQVMSNLVGNATKVTAEGGQVTLRVEARERELLFSVADDGPGIRKEDLERLFESYWRSQDAGYKGTGLGLAIARGIVDAHGGRIWPESVLGRGATFWFTIPIAEGDRVPIPAAR